MTVALKLDIGKATHPGRRRDHNEDSLDTFEPKDPDQQDLRGSLFVVADGMGGHEAGAVASDRAVRKTIDEYYYGDPSLGIRESLEQAIKVANQEVFDLAARKRDWAGMGTTLVCAVVRGEDELYVANVGDSRAYLIRGEGIRQITEDHTWVQHQVRLGKLTSEEARQHPRRSQITRSMGRRPEVEADIFESKLLPGDTIVLCSDGLTDVVRDEEIQTIISDTRSAQAAADKLVKLANHRGGPDNITVMVLRCPKGGIAGIAESAGMPTRGVLAGVVGTVFIGLIALWAIFGGIPGLGRSDTTATPTRHVAVVATTSPTHTTPPATATPSPIVPTATPTFTPATPKVASTVAPTSTRMPTFTPSPTRRIPTPTPTATVTQTPSPQPSGGGDKDKGNDGGGKAVPTPHP